MSDVKGIGSEKSRVNSSNLFKKEMQNNVVLAEILKVLQEIKAHLEIVTDEKIDLTHDLK